MSRKALHLVVNLEIQAVTCPGVWLCPNGNVQLLFSMLGQEVQTKRLPPIFPLLFHEKLTFQKTYPNAGCLAEVQDSLRREDVYAVLLQEVEDSTGGAAVQLARFHSNALHLLYPSPCAKGLLAGVDVDLLMEASADYPGILSPKIELSTKTIVKEVASSVHEGYIINPKTLSSQKIPLLRNNDRGDIRTESRDGRCRLHPSHHSEKGRKMKDIQANAHKPVHCRSAPSVQHNQGHQGGHCHCTSKCGFSETPDRETICQCGTTHLANNCPLCTQYQAMFRPTQNTQDTKNHHTDQCYRKQSTGTTFERTKRLSKALHSHVDRILEPTLGNILHERSIYGSDSRKDHQEYQSRQDEAPKRRFESDPCFKVSCGNGDEFGSHRELFYANLEKFYRKLYDRAKSRAQEEICLRAGET